MSIWRFSALDYVASVCVPSHYRQHYHLKPTSAKVCQGCVRRDTIKTTCSEAYECRSTSDFFSENRAPVPPNPLGYCNHHVPVKYTPFSGTCVWKLSEICLFASKPSHPSPPTAVEQPTAAKRWVGQTLHAARRPKVHRPTWQRSKTLPIHRKAAVDSLPCCCFQAIPTKMMNHLWSISYHYKDYHPQIGLKKKKCLKPPTSFNRYLCLCIQELLLCPWFSPWLRGFARPMRLG